MLFIVYIHNPEIDERHAMWYVHTCDTARDAATSAWKMYNGTRHVDDPEEYVVNATHINTPAGLFQVGNFSTGWMDMPTETFTGDVL